MPDTEQRRIIYVHDSGEKLCLAPLGEEDFSEDQGHLAVDEEGESPFVCSFRLDHWGWGELLLVKDVVVKAADPTTEAAIASTTLVDETEEIIKGSTSVETSRGNIMHVWKTIMHLHAISSSNYDNPSRRLGLILTREIKRKPTSKGGVHIHKTGTMCVHSRTRDSYHIRMHQKITSWMWLIMTTMYIPPSSLTRRRSDVVKTDHAPLRLQAHPPLQL